MLGTFLSERIVNYRCFIVGHGNRYSTLGASNNNRSTHTIDFHLSSHELLRIAIVTVLVYRVTTNIAAANGTGIIAGCNCDMGVLLSFSLTAVEGIDTRGTSTVREDTCVNKSASSSISSTREDALSAEVPVYSGKVPNGRLSSMLCILLAMLSASATGIKVRMSVTEYIIPNICSCVKTVIIECR